MSAAKAFFDTNVLLYLLSADDAKADRAEQTLAEGGIISVQVLNEFASVASRRLNLSHAEIGDFLTTARAMIAVVPACGNPRIGTGAGRTLRLLVLRFAYCGLGATVGLSNALFRESAGWPDNRAASGRAKSVC